MTQKMRCPDCGNELRVIPTPYGERATCVQDEVRWTRIWNERVPHAVMQLGPWTPEKWTGLGGNTA